MFGARRLQEHLIGGIEVQELDFILQICPRWYCREGEAAYDHRFSPRFTAGSWFTAQYDDNKSERMCTKRSNQTEVLMKAIGVCAEINERASHLCRHTHTRD